MFGRDNSLDHEDARRRKKQARPPARQDNERKPLHTVNHALGLNVSPKHKFSTHVYLIFHQLGNMPSENFVATLSFRTMYNDFRGMKTRDYSPASEDADPLYDKNGKDLRGVMVAKWELYCKIGWVKRIFGKDEMYLPIVDCLPFPIRPNEMESEEWENVRSQGSESRTKWVLKAIEALKQDELWESLPYEQFKARHDEVRKVARKKWKIVGTRPRPSLDTIQAKYLDEIMNDVGLTLYPKPKEEPKKIWDRYRRRGH
ncbi:hypothetical protein ACHAO8_011457 [Botrytis cinerea]